MHRIPIFIAALFVLSLASGADDSAQEAHFISNARQLTFEGKRSGEGYFHPNGDRLVFQSERDERNPFYQIYLLDLLSGESARVSPGLGKTTCAFFQPGTTRLLFASTHLDPQAEAKQKAELEFRASGKERRYAWDYDPAMDIFSCEQDGTQMQRLTDSPGYDAEGAYSPNGQQIVFCSLRAAYTRELNAEEKARLEKDAAYFGDIYVMNADGSKVRRLTTAPGYDGGPFFSPDGERIVWRRFDEHGMHADVYTMKRDGSDVRRLTEFKSMSWAPFYHPSGQYLIFTANKLGFENFELFIVNANGDCDPVRVTFTDGFDGLPVFSPDGKRLCWTSNRTPDKKSQLFLGDWNHDAAQQALASAPRRQITVAIIDEALGAVSVDGAIFCDANAVGLLNVDSLLLQPAITKDDLRLQAGWLAAEAREGRMTGSAGAKAAAAWLADYFTKIGLQKFGGEFLQPFEFDAGVKLIAGKNALEVTSDATQPSTVPTAPRTSREASNLNPQLSIDRDFRPLSFSDSGEAEGEVVFAGYGLSVPEGGKGGERYNSYEGLDVKDKIVLILRYVPEAVDPARRAQLNRYAGLRYKAMMARERGAKAALFVSGPNSPQAGELLPLAGDNTLAGSGILAHSITGKVADALLAPGGKSLKELQTGLDNENPHAEGGFLLSKVKVKLAVGVEHIKKTDFNVIAYLPPGDVELSKEKGSAGFQPAASGILPDGGKTGGSGAARVGDEAVRQDAGQSGLEARAPQEQQAESDARAEYIVVGAHYDHLGRGSAVSSMARSGEEGAIHPGADDNGSGVAAVMELAASLAVERREHPEKFRRGVIFALWSGEEIGIIGSAAFCAKPPVPIEKIAAYVNFDMIGRLRDNRLTLQGVGSSKVWRKLIEKRNVAAGFNLVLQDDPYLPTDTTSFYPKRVPVLNFFTGAHEDYHRPTDTVDKLDYAGVERITNFARQIILDVAGAPERPDLARVEKSDQGGGSRETLRAYLGTIPDYTTEVKGVKLSGVRAGSPAEKGGLKGGDVLVEFAGQKIANIYDYTYALDAVKIGQPVKLAVEREGKRVDLTVTPEARK